MHPVKPLSIGPHFSRTYAEILEKVTRVEIENCDGSGMFFFSCNPDPATKTDLQETLLCSLSLSSQWLWLSKRLDFYASLLSTRCSFMIIVPERTAEGNIHFHSIAKLKNDFEEFDIRRTFWQILDASIGNAKVRKYCVDIKPITSTGVVDYLFHKDAHDYEVIFNRTVNGVQPFQCMILHDINNNDTGSPSSEESEEDSPPQQPTRRKRTDLSHLPKKKH